MKQNEIASNAGAHNTLSAGTVVKGNINKSSIEVSYVDNTPPILSSIQNSSNGSWAKEVTLSWEIEETGSGIAKVEYATWVKFALKIVFTIAIVNIVILTTVMMFV